jgi:exonuclease VII small subunit
MATDKEKIKDSLANLEKIIEWFDKQGEVDVEEGLKKVKDGAVLIKSLKAKLKTVENEFEEIKKDLENEGE